MHPTALCQSGEATTCHPWPEVKKTALGRLIFLLSFFLAWLGKMNMFLAHPDGTHQMLLSEVVFSLTKTYQLKLMLFFFFLSQELWECILLQLL